MKKVLVPVIALLVLCVAAPVTAKPIGPQKAVKNPHIMITSEGAELYLPSGIGNGWTVDTDLSVMDSWHWKDASKFKIHEATSLTVDDLLGIMGMGDLTHENKWCYVSLEVLVGFVDLLVETGAISEAEGEQMKNEFTTMLPEGMYFMFVNVGN